MTRQFVSAEELDARRRRLREIEADLVAHPLMRLGISGPYDGLVEINSCETKTAMLLPLADVDLLIAALQNLDRTE